MTQVLWSAPDKFYNITSKFPSNFWMMCDRDNESTHKRFTFVQLKRYVNLKVNETIPLSYSCIRLLN